MEKSINQVAVATAMVLLLAGCVRRPSAPIALQRRNTDIENIGKRDINTPVKPLAQSPDSEIAAARQAALELEQQVSFVQDAVATAYLARISENIVKNSDSKVPFTIKVIDSDEISAIALPGGFLYLTRGAVIAADSEAELASLIAHKVAHVAARHTAEQHGKGPLVSPLALQPPPALSAAFYKFSRSDETEADWLGLQYTYKAGYDPRALVTFFEKLQSSPEWRGKLSSAFSSHPLTGDRAKLAGENIDKYLPARALSVVTTPEFQQMKARLTERKQ
jgi:predicted Zn-dependent protease